METSQLLTDHNIPASGWGSLLCTALFVAAWVIPIRRVVLYPKSLSQEVEEAKQFKSWRLVAHPLVGSHTQSSAPAAWPESCGKEGRKGGRENWEAGPSSSHSSAECDEGTREDSKLSVGLFVILEGFFHSSSKTAPAQPQPYTLSHRKSSQCQPKSFPCGTPLSWQVPSHEGSFR